MKTVWTEEDVARQAAKFQGSKVSAEYPNKAERDHKPAFTHPSSPEKHRGHKYQAEACLVTADLTLFSESDIAAAEASKRLFQERKTPLKVRGERCGILDTIWFGSLKEGRRYIELRRLEDAGAIQHLERQKPYELSVSGITIGRWFCDFRYEEKDHFGEWTLITEDAKGKPLPLDKWKRAHVEAQFGIKIRIT